MDGAVFFVLFFTICGLLLTTQTGPTIASRSQYNIQHNAVSCSEFFLPFLHTRGFLTFKAESLKHWNTESAHKVHLKWLKDWIIIIKYNWHQNSVFQTFSLSCTLCADSVFQCFRLSALSPYNFFFLISRILLEGRYTYLYHKYQ